MIEKVMQKTVDTKSKNKKTSQGLVVITSRLVLNFVILVLLERFVRR